MSVTFGSVGDIIATFQIAAQLLTALDESRGSARDFQDVFTSLTTFHRLLEQLVSIWPTRSECPQLEALHQTILPVVNECRQDITTFLDTIITKYGKSLGHNNVSKNKLKEMGKMLQWHIFEGSVVLKLKQRLDNSHGMISLAYMCAQGVAEEKDQTLVRKKLDFVKNRQDEIERGLDRRLDVIQNELVRQTGMLQGLSEELRRVISAISPITAANIEINGTNTEVLHMIQALYQLQVVQPSLSQPIAPYMEQSVILEDALGYCIRIPLETIRSWAVLKQVLIDNFADRQGNDLVRAGRYVLQDSVTGGDLSLTIPFHRVTRPGQKIVMTMVIYSSRAKDKANSCPRCATVTLSSGNQDINCSNPDCDVTFRQVTEEIDSLGNKAIDPSRNRPCLPDAASEDLTNETSNADLDMNEKTLELFLKNKADEDGPDVFKRVRLFTRWQDSMDSRGSNIANLSGASFWAFSDRRGDIFYSIIDALNDIFEKQPDLLAYIFNRSTQMRYIHLSIGFLGYTLNRSCPVVIIYSSKKELGQRSVKALGTWFRQHGFLVAFSTGQHWRRYVLNWVANHRSVEYTTAFTECV